MKKFSELFKKYRLRAEFETFTAFGDVLSEKGYIYEDSIFSHWQKGTRIPSSRHLVLKIIEIFIERDALRTRIEANEFLASAGMGYLTDKETGEFRLSTVTQSPFQIPNEIAHFTGREELIGSIIHEIKKGKVIHIFGAPGVGKTTLAIKIAHLLKHEFPDGILWYRMDNTTIKDVMKSTAYVFGEKLHPSNIEIMASFIRSLLSQKKVLLLLDNVEEKSNIHLLLPNSLSSNLIILSKQKNLYIPAASAHIHLKSFTSREVFLLYESILGKQYVRRYHSELNKLCQIVGSLPLAAHIFAHQLGQSRISPADLLNLVQKEEVSLRNLSYEDKNLYITINISYKNLSKSAQAVFLSLGVFEGKDFSSEAITYVNGLSKEKIQIILDELVNISLIERSIDGKYRIHPLVKKFIGEKLNNPYILTLNKISIFAFVIYTIYWVVTQTITNSYNIYNIIFSSSYFVVALWGAVWGIKVSKKWGGIKSTMGKAILFFSFGLFFQVIGQTAYAYYSLFEDIIIPYPSLGDIGYFGTIPLYIIGVFFLAKISGVKIKLSLLKNHFLFLIFAVIALGAGLMLFLQHYVFQWSNPLKVFLDFIYPVGDWFYVVFVMLIYFHLNKTKNNIMKNKILFFVIALFIQFIADSVFIYQANLEIWQGGNVNDYMYLISYLLMTFAILQLNSHMSRVITK